MIYSTQKNIKRKEYFGMSKDYMTDGRASWITYADPKGSVFVVDKNPWEHPLTIEDQLALIIVECLLEECCIQPCADQAVTPRCGLFLPMEGLIIQNLFTDDQNSARCWYRFDQFPCNQFDQ